MDKQFQTEKVFNTTERVVKEWIARFLGKDLSIFDYTPTIVEPFLFFPNEGSEGKYLELKLGVVEPDYSAQVDHLMGDETVISAIQFFVNSVKIVYGCVMKTLPRGYAHDVNLEWNPTTLSFDPMYMPDLSKKKAFLGYVLSCMMQARPGLTDENQEQWQTDLKQLMEETKANSENIIQENIEEKIVAKNLEWSSLHKIGVLVRFISEEDVEEKKEESASD